jgi:ligand-binding sensor domain-containing protein/signal transduction histidine kinase
MTFGQPHRTSCGNSVIRFITHSLSTLLCLAFAGPSSLALQSQKQLTQYVQRNWHEEQGLPHGSVYEIIQTRSGYIWIGTPEGLVRFDGVKFTLFDQLVTGKLPVSQIHALYEDRDETLWVGTARGLVQIRNNANPAITTVQGLTANNISSVLRASNNDLWVGTNGGGLMRIRDGEITSISTSNGLSHNYVSSIVEDHNGSVWVGTQHGLNRFRDNHITVYKTAHGLSHDYVVTIYEDTDRSLLIGTQGGLTRFRNDKFEPYNTLLNTRVNAVKRDHHGNLWLGTISGLMRAREDHFETLTTREGLPNSIVHSIYEDNEGSLWIGTDDGLTQLIDGPLTTYSTQEGLSEDITLTVLQARDGALWIGTRQGLNRMDQGKLVSFQGQEQLAGFAMYALGEAPDGAIWMGTNKGLKRLKDGNITTLTTTHGLTNDAVRRLAIDRNGQVWAGTSTGLNLITNGQIKIYGPGNQPLGKDITTIHIDNRDNVWVGTRDGMLNIFQNGNFSHFKGDFSVNGYFLWAMEEVDGSLWFGGPAGILRIKDDKSNLLSIAHGLPSESTFAALEDANGRIWFSSNRGIFYVSKSELEDVIAGRAAKFQAMMFSERDGMKSSECMGGTQPAGYKAIDGSLWFPTKKGIVAVNPDMTISKLPRPLIHVEQIKAGSQLIEPRGNVLVPSSFEGVEIHYTGLSFTAPDKMRFSYQLEGIDRHWVDAGSRRVAYYTNLPPGSYRFRVRAVSKDGRWGESTGDLALNIQARFYQTSWFQSLLIASIILSVVFLYRLRIRKLDARKQELEKLVAQRTRDLTEAKDKLVAANHKQVDFISGISHALKTPLSLVRLYGETLVLYGGKSSKEEVQSYYEIIARESERLTRLIDTVLDFSRVDREEKRYSFQVGNLASVAGQAIEVYLHHLRNQGFTVDVDLPPNLPLVRFDPNAVSEAIVSLLDNAAKYGDEAKYIAVRARAVSARVLIEIEDHGVGVPEGERESVFQQFYRGSNVRDTGGYGLGLFMVQHAMKAHGGSAEVESSLSRGSIFRLVFPVYFAPGSK